MEGTVNTQAQLFLWIEGGKHFSSTVAHKNVHILLISS